MGPCRRASQAQWNNVYHSPLKKALTCCLVAGLESYLVSVHKWPFYPNSSLLSKFNPRNIVYMPVVKFIERLDLEQKISFMDRHCLRKPSISNLFND